MQKLFLGVLVAGLLFYVFLWSDAPYMADDSYSYLAMARDLQDLHLERLHERAPGYPLLLLLAGATDEPKRLLFGIQLFLYGVSIFFLYRLATQLNFSKITILALLIFSLLPHSVEMNAFVLTESLSAFPLVVGTVSLGFWILGKSKVWLVVSCLLLGLSFIVRPAYQLLSPAIAICLFIGARLWVEKKRQLHVAALSIFMSGVLFVGGYILFNVLRFGYAGVAPRIGFSLSTKTVRVVERIPDQEHEIREILIQVRNEDLIKRGSSHTASTYIWQAIPELQKTTGLSRLELEKRMLSINLALIKAAPLEYLQDVMTAFSGYWFPYTDIANFDSRKVQMLNSILHFVLIAVFASQLVLWVNQFMFRLTNAGYPVSEKEAARMIAIALCLCIIFYTAVISSCLEIGEPRYRVPTDLLILFATLCGFSEKGVSGMSCAVHT